MNYFNTFIEVAADCPAAQGARPKARAAGKTVAELEFELIGTQPYRYTQEDVQFHVHCKRTGLTEPEVRSNGAALRAAFFAKPVACMRTSALPKTYGWGLHFDDRGRVALVSVGTPEYQTLANDARIAHTRAMRSKRA
jgi:hypothetical protein